MSFFSKTAGRIIPGKYIDRGEETVKVQMKSRKDPNEGFRPSKQKRQTA
jgi:hypothetical protein